MSKVILIAGESASGKSSSMRNLPPSETFIIQTIRKELPFRGARRFNKKDKNIGFAEKAQGVLTALGKLEKEEHIKYIIIDDSQFILANEYFNRANEVGFAKYDQGMQNFINVIKKAGSLREDQYVFLMHHTDSDSETGQIKIKTLGDSVNKKVCIESYFSIVLMAVRLESDYCFMTNGFAFAKSPCGMFEHQMENDLEDVILKVDGYFNYIETDEVIENDGEV